MLLALLIAATVIVWLPFAIFLVALALSSATGCALNEATVNPCVIAGIDLGGPLTDALIGGWVRSVIRRR